NNDYVNTGTGITSILTGTNTVTAEGWIKPKSSRTFHTIVGNYDAGNLQFLLRLDNMKPVFWVSNGAFTSVTGTTTVPLNTWTHVAGVWDGTTIKVYVNGALENTVSVSGTMPTNSYPVKIGANYSNISENCDGVLDEVRIWNVARTQTEISNSMNTPLAGNESGLLAYYDFESGSGTQVLDRTSNGYDGNFSGTPVWTTGQLGAGASPCTIADQTVTAAETSFICEGETTIDLASSEVGVDYYLRN
ncbi:LamG domain-containing protein, partial [Fulvivirga sp. RKSG066]|uniref:LamG domain-containing protein n=1 Tax=Fulvivirga aurantia TaxID=2529383 RepID=UPI00162589D7